MNPWFNSVAPIPFVASVSLVKSNQVENQPVNVACVGQPSANAEVLQKNYYKKYHQVLYKK
jgi:hypothetical protein